MHENKGLPLTAIDDTQLVACVEAAGLQASWQRWPDEVRDAMALAATYVDMLPPTVDAHIAPWVFPLKEGEA